MNIVGEAIERKAPRTRDAGSGTVLINVLPVHRKVAAGLTLFRQGDRSFGIFLLERGRVRLQRVTPDGAAVSIHLVRPGEMFAEASLFSERYHCDAVAEVDSEISLYLKDDLTRHLRAEPEVLWAFAKELAHRLQGLRLRYELKQIRSAPERVLQLLRTRSDKGGAIRITGALQDLASEVGLTREALYRALATLETKGRIARYPGGIRLIGAGC